MDIERGYKQAEIGVIPEDWAVKLISDIAKVVRGGSPRPAGDRKYFGGSFVPWLTVAALTNIPDSELYVSEMADYLTKEGANYSRTLESDTVIIANSGATLGIAKILKIKCCANDGIAALIDQTEGDKRFICYVINSQTKRLREVVASGNGQPNLNTHLIGSIQIPFPPPSEQQAIADALSEVDDQISALDALIAKKRDLKQGAMQQLLTGEKRLPGFSRDWEMKQFGNIAVPRKERIDPKEAGAQDFCVELEYIEPETGRLLGSTTAEEQSSLKTVFSERDVLFGKLRAYLRKYWLANRSGVCSTEIWALVPNTDLVSSEYLFQIVKRDQFIEVASNSYGTHMPRSDWNLVKNFEMAIPLPDEQVAITTILSDMDSEITALEEQREKTVALKRGMMQELLTGRTRLI